MKTTGLFIILTFGLLSLQAQPGSYKWVNVSPFNDVSGIDGCFISENEGWIFQNNNTKRRELYYTNDGANTFKIIASMVDSSIHHIKMFDTKNGILLFHNSNNVASINRTIDGGKTWYSITPNISDSVSNLYYFLDTSIFFSFEIDYNTPEIKISKTTNAGRNWYITDYPKFEKDGITPLFYGPRDLFFLNYSVGWLAGSTPGRGYIIQTINGGESWRVIYERTIEIDYIHYFNEHKGVCSGRGDYSAYVDISENNFNSITFNYWWNEICNYSTDVCYFNDSTIWVVGWGGTIYKSINSGLSFESYPLIEGDYSDHIFNSINFFNNTGYIFSNRGALLKLSNPFTDIAKNLKSFESLDIYPNPFANNFSVKNNTNKPFLIELYNDFGKLFQNSKLDAFSTININATTWPAGVYVIKTGAQQPYKKIIKL